MFNRRCTLGSSRNQLRDIQTPPKSGMLYRSKGSCSIPIFTRWIKQWRWLFFFAVNLATEKVKNWNLCMEDFKHLKDARVNSIWKWNNPFNLIYLRNVVTYVIFQFRPLTIKTKRPVCKSSKVIHNVTMGMFSSHVFQKFKNAFLATKNNSTG